MSNPLFRTTIRAPAIYHVQHGRPVTPSNHMERLCTTCVGVLQKRTGRIAAQDPEFLLFPHHRRAASLEQRLLCPRNTVGATRRCRARRARETRRLSGTRDVDAGSPDLVACCCLCGLMKGDVLGLSGVDAFLLKHNTRPDVEKVTEERDVQALFILQNVRGNYSITPSSSFAKIRRRALQEFVFGRPVSTNTHVEEQWSLAQSWLEECTQDHKRCNDHTGSPTWYPTRLLDLGAHGDQLGRLSVMTTSLTPPLGPYVTLSHCWGTIPML